MSNQKRSLEDYGFQTNLKRRRHLSPQNSNIDLNTAHDSSCSIRKTSRTKSTNSLNGQIYRKTSFQHMTDIDLPNWNRMCPHIDQILSNKHIQSGVFAHEVQLVQQELEALLSMAYVRETILNDMLKSSNNDNLRSKIRRYKRIQRIYSTKKLSKHKLVQQQTLSSSKNVDRQVSLAPIECARIERIWSDLSAYFYRISLDDIRTLENFVELNRNFEQDLTNYIDDYQQNLFTEHNFRQYFHRIHLDRLNEFGQINSILTHYIHHTAWNQFQTKLYEHIGRTSPVYKTPISSPMHHRNIGNCFIRISPRLRSISRTNLLTDDDDDGEPESSSVIKRKFHSQILSIDACFQNEFQQRIDYVQQYLTNQTSKQTLINEPKRSQKRKHSFNNMNPCSFDKFQQKLCHIRQLIHECYILTQHAYQRAKQKIQNENIHSNMNTIECDLETFIDKFNCNIEHVNCLLNDNVSENIEQLIQQWRQFQQQYH